MMRASDSTPAGVTGSMTSRVMTFPPEGSRVGREIHGIPVVGSIQNPGQHG